VQRATQISQLETAATAHMSAARAGVDVWWIVNMRAYRVVEERTHHRELFVERI
jgi:hypothetical protein